MGQLTLFASELLAAQSAPVAGLTKYAPMEALIACPVIEAELLEIFRGRPNDWLTWSAYRPVMEKHGIGFGLGHKLGSMQRRGLLEERVIYLGRGIDANRPSSPEYQGFRIEYSLVTFAHEREIVMAA